MFTRGRPERAVFSKVRPPISLVSRDACQLRRRLDRTRPIRGSAFVPFHRRTALSTRRSGSRSCSQARPDGAVVDDDQVRNVMMEACLSNVTTPQHTMRRREPDPWIPRQRRDICYGWRRLVRRHPLTHSLCMRRLFASVSRWSQRASGLIGRETSIVGVLLHDGRAIGRT